MIWIELLYTKKKANSLSHLIGESKKEYFKSQFARHKGNLKSTWKLIGKLIQRKTKGQFKPTRIVYGNKTCTTKPLDIAEQLNAYFVNVGANLAKNLNYDPTISPT